MRLPRLGFFSRSARHILHRALGHVDAPSPNAGFLIVPNGDDNLQMWWDAFFVHFVPREFPFHLNIASPLLPNSVSGEASSYGSCDAEQ